MEIMLLIKSFWRQYFLGLKTVWPQRGVNLGSARFGVLLFPSCVIDGVRRVHLDRRRTSSSDRQAAFTTPYLIYQFVCRAGAYGYCVFLVSAYAGHLRDT